MRYIATLASIIIVAFTTLALTGCGGDPPNIHISKQNGYSAFTGGVYIQNAMREPVEIESVSGNAGECGTEKAAELTPGQQRYFRFDGRCKNLIMVDVETSHGDVSANWDS